MSLLEQRATGHTAPKYPSLQFPHPKTVFLPDSPNLGFADKQRIESRQNGLILVDSRQGLHPGSASERKDRFMFRAPETAIPSIKSSTHCLSRQASVMVGFLPSLAYESRRAALSNTVSRLPPAAHSATQESHPTTSMDEYRSIIFLISLISLSSATITGFLLGWLNHAGHAVLVTERLRRGHAGADYCFN